MSPDTPMFGRITINANRISLGRCGTSMLLVRVAQQLRKIRPSDDTVIQIELSRNNLPDSTTFDKLASAERQLGERIITNMDAASPFPYITVGRVAEVMATPEYEAYDAICVPEKRMTLSQSDIDRIIQAYVKVAPDCVSHFPKWID